MIVEGSIVKPAARALWSLATWYGARNDERFRMERDEMFQAWTAEVAQYVRRHEVRLGALEASERVALETLIADPQFGRVLDNYGYDAAREPLDERRRMLASAAAGSVTPRLSLGQLARVQRAIRELDADDLRLLRTIAALAPSQPPTQIDQRAEIERMQRELLESSGASGHALLAAGCVDVRVPTQTVYGGFTTASITPVGEWLMEVCALYGEGNTPLLATKREVPNDP